MAKRSELKSIFEYAKNIDSPWDGNYKIPWDDPKFSKRMLKEHLSQDHDLASRRSGMIIEQVDWIHVNICNSNPKRILDIGCGPGLYLKHFANKGYIGKGMDFSPASIEYAKNIIGGKFELICDDIRKAEFGENFDLVSMIYGEFNVFSPDEINMILRKACNSLNDSGTIIIEPYKYEAVKAIGQTRDTWYKTTSGLFSEKPHICLIENQWNNELKLALQCFHIIDIETCEVNHYRSTTKAWTEDEYEKMLLDAGFNEAYIEPDWPSKNNDLFFMRAVK